MPTADDERVTDKTRSKRPAAALVLTNTIDGETNKETNSSDTENASPAIPIGPKDVNSVSTTHSPHILANTNANFLLFGYGFAVRGREL